MASNGFNGPTPERRALAESVARFRRDGMTYQEISEELGISHGYVGELIHDPDGEDGWRRKRRYGGVCRNCGAHTDGSNGPRKAPDLCHKCSPTIRAQEKHYWTRARVVEAIRAWADEHGCPPTALDWRRNQDGYPNMHAVYNRNSPLVPFDSWAEAIEAAGFKKPHSGKRRGQERDWNKELVLHELRRQAVAGYAPTGTHDKSLYRAATYYYGNWSEAIEAAGLKERLFTNTRQTSWTAERVLEEIRALAIGDLPPSLSELRHGGKFSNSAYGHFGSWNNAVRMAGFEPLGSGPSRRSKRRKELLEAFKQAA